MWTTIIQRMQSFAGHGSGFPVIGPREPPPRGLRRPIGRAVPPSAGQRRDPTWRSEYDYTYDRDLRPDIDVLPTADASRSRG